MTGYCRGVSVSVVASSIGLYGLLVSAQVDEGETQIINIRETDGRLGPLVFTLVALGCVSLVATAIFWWLTRPRRMHHVGPNSATSHQDERRTEGDV